MLRPALLTLVLTLSSLAIPGTAGALEKRNRVAARNTWQLLLQIATPESAQKYLTHELSEEELAEIEA
jgi:hypothetical protein